MSGQFQQLQALEDAIAFRRARVAVPCPDCRSAGPGQRCDDHACDLSLIAGYQQTALAVIVAVSGRIAARRAGIARPGED